MQVCLASIMNEYTNDSSPSAAGADTFTILYDKNRMYIGGVKAAATSKEGNDVSAVDVTVDEASSVVKVTVGDDLEKGKTFEIVIEPAA